MTASRAAGRAAPARGAPAAPAEGPTRAASIVDTVLAGGYCIGCGACTVLPGSPMRMRWTDEGLYEATATAPLDADTAAATAAVCPFSAAALDEDALGRAAFPGAPAHHAAVGRFERCYVGAVRDERVRAAASSGGLGRYLAAALLAEGHVDRVLHVVPRARGEGAGEVLFGYTASDDPHRVEEGAKSVYHPVTLAELAEVLAEGDARLAVTALPCFVKALRLLARHDERVRRNVRFTIGLFCGGLRSARYAEMIAWQLGVHPDELASVDFRAKFGDRPANHKKHVVRARDGRERFGSSKELFGTDYGMGFFKPRACDHCDDVTAELADASVGDAWLPDRVGDPRGTSAVVVRSPVIAELVERHRAEGALALDEVGPDVIAASQASGLRHRREGTRYRSERAAARGEWAPPKRAFELPMVPPQRRAVYDLREEIRGESHRAFAEALARDDYGAFAARMAPYARRYRRLLSGSIVRRVLNRLRRLTVRGRPVRTPGPAR